MGETEYKLRKFKDLFKIDIDECIKNSDIEKICVDRSKKSIKIMLFSYEEISDKIVELCKRKLFDLRIPFELIEIECKVSND